jgi:hypothetical protein
MALPRGSIRGLVTLWLIGGFLIFAFLGKDAFDDAAMYDKVFASFATLAATVAGYYFGARTGQKLDDGGDAKTPTTSKTPTTGGP